MNNDNYVGVVNLLKPPGMSSHSAVNAMRKIFDTKKVGHTGTLDPGAAGVLPICIGKATRISEYLMEKQKEYYAEIIFGFSTDTYDSYGEVVESSDKFVDIETLKNAVTNVTGEIEQNIPPYSAKKVDGQKLYDLARKGKAIDNITKKVTINSITVVEQIQKNTFLLKIECSMGTYIRAICNDLGKIIGIPAHMGMLIRTKSGDFHIENSYTIDELKLIKENLELDKVLISMDKALNAYPIINIDNTFKKYVENGRKVPVENAEIEQDKLGKNLYICFCDNIFYGIAEIENDLICFEKLLNV